jgi:hypothetical protein
MHDLGIVHAEVEYKSDDEPDTIVYTKVLDHPMSLFMHWVLHKDADVIMYQRPNALGVNKIDFRNERYRQ